MKIYLSITDPAGKKKTFPISTMHTTMGRSNKAKIPINDGLCSGIHCKFYVESDCVFVEDMGSKNGVFLNEIKVKKQRLYVGDSVRIGTSKVQIEDSKMKEEAIAAHTSEHGSRKDGSIKLELESFQEQKSRTQKSSQKQKEYMKSSKLYDGVAADSKKAKLNAKTLVFFEKLALIVDLGITLSLMFGPIVYLQKKNKKFMAMIMKDPVQILAGESLLYLAGGLVVGIFFFAWNRNREKGTIGEQIFDI